MQSTPTPTRTPIPIPTPSGKRSRPGEVGASRRPVRAPPPLLERERRPLVREPARLLGERVVPLVEGLEVGLGEVLRAHEPVARPSERGHHLVELELDRERVLALGPLDQEHHEEGHDRGPGVDEELPGVGVVEEGAEGEPDHDHPEGEREPRGTRAPARGLVREELERVVDRLRPPSVRRRRHHRAGRARSGATRRAPPPSPSPRRALRCARSSPSPAGAAARGRRRAGRARRTPSRSGRRERSSRSPPPPPRRDGTRSSRASTRPPPWGCTTQRRPCRGARPPLRPPPHRPRCPRVPPPIPPPLPPPRRWWRPRPPPRDARRAPW